MDEAELRRKAHKECEAILENNAEAVEAFNAVMQQIRAVWKKYNLNPIERKERKGNKTQVPVGLLQQHINRRD